jgi:hypothetical protein
MKMKIGMKVVTRAFGIEHEVGAQYRSDCTACAHHRHLHLGTDMNLKRCRRETARDIEQQESPTAKAIRDIVPEDPQVPQVADEVKPAAMKKHVREERRPVLRQSARSGQPRRRQREAFHELFQLGFRELLFIHEDDCVQKNERPYNHRRAA